jgi:hypothetical protein
MLSVPKETSQLAQMSPSSAIGALISQAQEAMLSNNVVHAEALLKRACKQAQIHFGDESAAVASLLWHLSIVYEQAGDSQRADEIVWQIQKILMRRISRRQ